MAQPNSNTPLFPTAAKALTKSDTDRFPPSAVYVGGPGDVVALLEDGTSVTFAGIPAGGIVPVMVVGIGASSTATSFVRIG